MEILDCEEYLDKIHRIIVLLIARATSGLGLKHQGHLKRATNEHFSSSCVIQIAVAEH